MRHHGVVPGLSCPRVPSQFVGDTDRYAKLERIFIGVSAVLGFLQMNMRRERPIISHCKVYPPRNMGFTPPSSISAIAVLLIDPDMQECMCMTRNSEKGNRPKDPFAIARCCRYSK